VGVLEESWPGLPPRCKTQERLGQLHQKLALAAGCCGRRPYENGLFMGHASARPHLDRGRSVIALSEWRWPSGLKPEVGYNSGNAGESFLTLSPFK